MYRIYQKAGDAYQILVRGAAAPQLAASAVAVPENEDVAEFLTAARDFLLNYGAFKADALNMKVSPGKSFFEVEKLLAGAAVADFVNPYDLRESPHLQLLGTLFIPPTTSV